MKETSGTELGKKTAQPFMRESSGLVRAMSPYSAFAYIILAVGVIFPWVYLLSAGAFPGSNIALGILLTGIFACLQAFVYSGLASVMPRTGGDYLFQSRVLSPWVGFPVVATMIIFWFLQWDALAGWITSVLGVAPMLTGLGLTLGSGWLISAGTWFTTPMGIWLTTIGFGALGALVLIRGLQLFVKIQWFMWYGFLISYATIVGLLLLTPHASFVSHFNAAVSKISPSVGSDYYDYVIAYEKSQGFNPNVTFSWIATLGVMPIALTSLGWVGWAQYQAGEIRQASSFRKQLFINLGGGGITATLMMALLAYALTNCVGYSWLSAAAYGSYMTGNLSMPIPPWFSNLAVVLTSNPIIVLLATVGIFLNALQVVFNGYIGQTRMAFAAAMDRILPAWIFKINERTGTPVNAYLVFFVLGYVVYPYVYNFVPSFLTYTLAVTAVATVMWLATSLAGALLPYRMKEVYQNSEVSKLKIFGVPLITVAGIISAAFQAWMLYYYLTVPGLGVASFPSEMLMLATFLGWLTYFAIRRWHVKNKTGIPIELAFKEIPPE